MIRQLWVWQSRIRGLLRITTFANALKLTFGDNTPRETRIYLKPLKQDVIIRLGTTDVNCLAKVFLADEYRLPFPEHPRLIIDGGANTGMATLYFAQQFPTARIVAIEPETSNFEVLCRNCGHLPNVTLVHAALWPECKSLRISDSSAEKWEFIVTDRPVQDENAPKVRSITIDQILAEANESEIGLLKLDIEGSELDLFSAGAERWLAKVHVIAIELHDRFRPGCAQALYGALSARRFVQEIRGENIFIKLT
jgi:FkbM family methyltransferase